MEEHIKWLAELTPEDKGILGPKAINLAILARAGLPVPPGFCISGQALWRALDGGDLKAWSPSEIVESNEGDNGMSTRQSSSRRLSALVTKFASSVLASEVTAAYRVLCSAGTDPCSVAVRSSAVCENGEVASYAGQFDSFLNVVGEEDLTRCIAKCWCSRASPRVRAYQALFPAASTRDGAIHMSVIVQEMVQAHVSGVVSTIDPVTGDDDRMVIEAVWGLGIGLVSGRISPDTYVVSRHSGEILQSWLGEKLTKVCLREGGGTVERPVATEKRSLSTLTESQLAEVVRLARRVEEILGLGQDIEWTYDGIGFHVLQARPVTGLPG